MTDEDSAPPAFLCPISHCLMTDPVVDSDGHTYDRPAILRWLETAGAGASPITRRAMTREDLRPNRTLRQAIQEWATARSAAVCTARTGEERTDTIPPQLAFLHTLKQLRAQHVAGQAAVLVIVEAMAAQPTTVSVQAAGLRYMHAMGPTACATHAAAIMGAAVTAARALPACEYVQEQALAVLLDAVVGDGAPAADVAAGLEVTTTALLTHALSPEMQRRAASLIMVAADKHTPGLATELLALLPMLVFIMSSHEDPGVVVDCLLALVHMGRHKPHRGRMMAAAAAIAAALAAATNAVTATAATGADCSADTLDVRLWATELLRMLATSPRNRPRLMEYVPVVAAALGAVREVGDLHFAGYGLRFLWYLAQQPEARLALMPYASGVIACLRSLTGLSGEEDSMPGIGFLAELALEPENAAALTALVWEVAEVGAWPATMTFFSRLPRMFECGVRGLTPEPHPLDMPPRVVNWQALLAGWAVSNSAAVHADTFQWLAHVHIPAVCDVADLSYVLPLALRAMADHEHDPRVRAEGLAFVRRVTSAVDACALGLALQLGRAQSMATHHAAG
jgi:hypothetical protein